MIHTRKQVYLAFVKTRTVHYTHIEMKCPFRKCDVLVLYIALFTVLDIISFGNGLLIVAFDVARLSWRPNS